MARRRTDLVRVQIIIALVVTAVWAISFIASVIPQLDYKPDPGIHGVMLIVAGSFFGSAIMRRENGG